MPGIRISFLGAGRVAEALCLGLFSSGNKIVKIVSPGLINGPALAARCESEWSSVPSFPENTQMLIVSVPDSRLEEALNAMECSRETLVAHTAGSYGLDVFPDRISRKAVFYPLQTFTKGRSLNLRDVPLFIEADNENDYSLLEATGSSLGCVTHRCGAEKRKVLHAAAVFVSNFTNHMLVSGNHLAERAGFAFDILVPLIRETVAKAIETGPAGSQTGPAIRNDLITIEKHKELLSFSPELRRLYEEVTRAIIKYHEPRTKDKK